MQVCELVATFDDALGKVESSKTMQEAKDSEKVEKAVDNYKQSIQELELSDEVADQLTSFLLGDLYKSTKPKVLARNLQQHLYDIMVNDENECGYAQICSKT